MIKDVLDLKNYNIVLIGCGHMGEDHIKEIYYKENATIYGVVDINEEKAKNFCRKYEAASWSADYHKYLEDPHVNIVIICTYPSTHLQILKECIKHNKHVICEKPITDNLDDGREFVDLVKKARVKVLIGHILRHNKSYIRIKDIIRNGLIGSPIIMRIVQNHHTLHWSKYRNLINETSPLIDCGVHYMDIMRWFTGAEPVSVSGVSARTEEDIDKGKFNYEMAILKFNDGSTGYYEVGWGHTVSFADLKEFIGPKGRIKLTYQKDRTSNKEEGDLIEFYRYPEKVYETININCLRKPTGDQFNYLIRMIEENIESNPSIDDVFKAFEISVTADKAASNNCTMNLINLK